MTTPQEQSSTVRAFVYLRVSSKSQVDGDGFERQKLACESYAASNSIEIVEIFSEQIAGKNDIEDRVALPELLAALEENGVKTVIVERLDRLARDLLVQETIVADMMKHGYTLISVAEPDLCTNDPSRVMMRQIFGAVAQYDKSMIVAKLKAARNRIKARDGQCEGKKAYGKLPGEAETLEKMRALRGLGNTYAQIAPMLDFLGCRTRAGGKWHAATVGKILKGPKGTSLTVTEQMPAKKGC